MRMINTLAVAFVLVPTQFLLCAQAAPDGAALQNASPQSSVAGSKAHLSREHHTTPKVELFVGYSYLRSVPSPASGNRIVGLNGGATSIAFNINRYLGVVGDFGGYNDTRLQLTGAGADPARVSDSGGSVFSYMGGPRLSYRNHSRITPFAQVLLGGVHASEVTLSNCSGAGCTPLPAQNAFAIVGGGGVDIRVFHRLSIRAIQAEYMMTRFADPTTNAGAMQNDLRLSSGLVYRFGGGHATMAAAANRPPIAMCSVDHPSVNAGGVLAVHGQASDPDDDPLSYLWTADSGVVQGSGADVNWNSEGSAPGSYMVNLRVVDGRGGVADCSAMVQVEAPVNHVPTLSCVADPSVVSVGNPVSITTTANDPDSDPLTFSWDANGGKIVGSGAAVTFDSSGLTGGKYTVTGHVNDGRGGMADCSVDIETVTLLEAQLALHSIYFPTAQPTDGHPDRGLLASQKQTLVALANDFKTYLETKPEAHLILEGHSDPRASQEYNQTLSERRVVVTKRFLIALGVPEVNIDIKAFGDQQPLTESEVKEEVEHNPDLTSDQLQRVLAHMSTITLASNRRVDVTLSTTRQSSTRQYPFNAADSLTLIDQDKKEAMKEDK
jgi:hypothetical protein